MRDSGRTDEMMVGAVDNAAGGSRGERNAGKSVDAVDFDDGMVVVAAWPPLSATRLCCSVMGQPHTARVVSARDPEEAARAYGAERATASGDLGSSTIVVTTASGGIIRYAFSHVGWNGTEPIFSVAAP